MKFNLPGHFTGAISNGCSVTWKPPRAGHGNSSCARGLEAYARFLITGHTTGLSEACARPASSGNCSKSLGLDANARFLVTSARAVCEPEDFGAGADLTAS